MAKALIKAKPSTKTPSSRRRFIRFAPDPGTIAFILTDHKAKKLEFPLQCLILEEAFAGCGLVAINPGFIKKGAKFLVQVGQLPPMKCEVRWTKSLDTKVIAFGVYYLE